MSKPKSVIFFRNGLTAVFDENGEQMPRYQRSSTHKEAISLLWTDGYKLEDLEVTGEPIGRGGLWRAWNSDEETE